MRDLLKEAIADAKAVRETALANAKIALEEAFTPRLQSMISARLREEEEMDMEEPVTEEDEMDMDMPVEEGDEMEMDMPVEEGEDEDYMAEEEMDMEEPVAEEEDMDAELDEILRELEGDEMDMEEPVSEEEDMEEPVAEGDEEEISIEEVIRALREEEDMEEPVAEEEEAAPAETEKELAEAIKVIKFLKSKINEVNLLNAKLLFSNKLFRNYPLSESQKVKVIENFDRARTVREVKLVYGTISESLKSAKTKRPMVKESYASRPSKSTAPKKAILSEGNDLAARWKKLANLK
jgi:hypothetical protein